MFNLPLHPLVVHFPIVLGVLLPFAGLVLWWSIKKEWVPQKAWAVVTALALVYSVSAVVTVELGERDEDKVEKVVSERVIEEHEEAGEMIPWVAGSLFLISFAGLLIKRSHHARMAVVVLSLVAIIPLIDAGHTGGKLVYQYGAANAHLPADQLALIQSGDFHLDHGYDAGGEEDDDDKDDD